MKTWAIIPTRGGSQRVLHKNIVGVAGRLLIAYTVVAALRSKYISQVIVSTECPEIAAVSEERAR